MQVYAAGSLREAFTELVRSGACEPATLTFGAAGLLRERIERGEQAQVFASADLSQPERLARQGGWMAPVVFTRNSLCALVATHVEIRSATLLDTLLDPEVRVGTSTPNSDPSGDYAWALFDKADALRPGAGTLLKAKALQLTGAADSPRAPAGLGTYAWVMAQGWADVFLTYRTNALAACEERSDLRMLELPAELQVGARYGASCRDDAPPSVRAWLSALLSTPVQQILVRHGFEAA
ncbi:MAG: substrate-binding domain-containing protein [Hydrogenophaga sp.]|uniref:substrate-binding domain-containing protein n=1 Tax=Hydrogenophaga sp. TaxID=1904254 RepID=UPI003D0B0F6C